jgi:hypothetical protein
MTATWAGPGTQAAFPQASGNVPTRRIRIRRTHVTAPCRQARTATMRILDPERGTPRGGTTGEEPMNIKLVVAVLVFAMLLLVMPTVMAG